MTTNKGFNLREHKAKRRVQAVISLALWVREQVEEAGHLDWGELNGVALGRSGREYLMARIARDNPTVFRKALRGEYSSVNQAAIAAGIVKPPGTEEATPTAIAEKLVKKYPQGFCRQVARELNRLAPGIQVKGAPAIKQPGRPRSARSDLTEADIVEDLRRQRQAEREADERRTRAETEETTVQAARRRERAEERRVEREREAEQRAARQREANERRARVADRLTELREARERITVLDVRLRGLRQSEERLESVGAGDTLARVRQDIEGLENERAERLAVVDEIEGQMRNPELEQVGGA